MRGNKFIQIALIVTNHLPMQMTVPIMANQTFNSRPCFIKNYYSWDLSTETYLGLTSLQFFYKASASPVFTSTTIAFSGNNIGDVCAAMNSFGVGEFYVSGSTLFAFSDVWVYADLILA